ncbi:MAG TPA: DUF4136 domain-containing protein [Opitutaceae bacterium]
MTFIVRILPHAVLLFAALVIAGCTTPEKNGGQTVVPLVWIDGRHVLLSPAEIARIRPELEPLMAQRGLALVTDLASADFLVTIRYEPAPTAGEAARVHVVSLSENRLRSQRAMSLNEMDNSVDASRSATSAFPGDIGTAEPSRGR